MSGENTVVERRRLLELHNKVSADRAGSDSIRVPISPGNSVSDNPWSGSTDRAQADTDNTDDDLAPNTTGSKSDNTRPELQPVHGISEEPVGTERDPADK